MAGYLSSNNHFILVIWGLFDEMPFDHKDFYFNRHSSSGCSLYHTAILQQNIHKMVESIIYETYIFSVNNNVPDSHR